LERFVTPELEQKLADLPTTPGVYLMKGHDAEIIYVGKAVNLRNRVRAYFTRTDTRAFVGFLDRFLADVDTVTVKNEKEALLLENELIKKHKPRFNVQLRDDKNFLCLRLALDHPYPRLETVRRISRDSARYFGPYASAASIRETLRVVNKYFQLRTCTDYALENRRRPCLLYQIGRCPAPCVNPIDPLEYKKNVDAVILFLEGRSGPLIDSLRTRMKDAAGKLAFEEAARLRDQVIALERSLERQSVAATEQIDQDIFGFYREADRILIYALYVRGGRIGGGQPFFFSGQEFPDDELLASFVNLYYDADNFLPKQVLLPFAPGPLDALSELLSEKKGERVKVHVPQRGDKADLMRLASQNAERAFSERKRSREETHVVLERLKVKLHLRNVPHRMECFDISHFQGKSIVASQVASVDGESDKNGYRHFRVKTVLQNDDFASMHEILSRRFRRGVAEGDLPDLIVIDGGKGQLASAQAAMKDLGVEGVDLVSLAKSRDLEVEDRDVESKASPERVFLVGRKDPIVLPQSSPELFMLTRLRDEAHRFAITFQRQLSRKRGLASELEQIPGVGDGRRRTLLKHFGSVKRIREATIDEIALAVGPAVAERVHAWLHGKKVDDDQVRAASLEDAGSPVAE
jgi:excinuclease ABC subunit C